MLYLSEENFSSPKEQIRHTEPTVLKPLYKLLKTVRSQIYTPLVILIDFSLTVKAATLILISRRGLAISSAKGKSIYNLVRN